MVGETESIRTLEEIIASGEIDFDLSKSSQPLGGGTKKDCFEVSVKLYPSSYGTCDARELSNAFHLWCEVAINPLINAGLCGIKRVEEKNG